MIRSSRLALYLSCLSFILLLASACNDQKQYNTQGSVHLEQQENKFTLIRNGKPFLVKGVAGYSHLDMLNYCGGNTIRTWDTTNLAAILDSAQRHNIAVVAGLPLYNSNHIRNYYSDPAEMDLLYQKMHDVVSRHKQHPALLMWCLGNELNYFYKPEDDFFIAFNRIVNMIHTEDPNHPVTTALLNFGKKSIYNVKDKIPDLDIISINTYGRLSSLKNDLENFSWYWDGPFMIGEWGINGYWESDSTAWGAPIEDTSTKKAEQYRKIYEERMPYSNERFLGSFVFYWGFQHEKTPTWYSLFSDDGATSEAVEVFSDLWQGKPFEHHAPQVDYTLVDGKGARDNVILASSSKHHAEVIVRHTIDSLRFRWEILPEDWYKEKEDDSNKNKIAPAKLDGLIEGDGTKVEFRSPTKEGPYRIYVWVYDRHGNFATSNTPFYVIKE